MIKLINCNLIKNKEQSLLLLRFLAQKKILPCPISIKKYEYCQDEMKNN